MPSRRLPALMIALIAAPANGAADRDGAPVDRRAAPPVRSATRVIIQRRMIIRVPRVPLARAGMAGPAALPPIRWVERKADRCVPVVDLAAAAVTGADSVDLLLNGGRRLRARFGDECPALDFYSGFYVTMTRDGKVCAARDSIRARSGGECRIKSFRTLVPAR